jgi:hypothetical protein
LADYNAFHEAAVVDAVRLIRSSYVCRVVGCTSITTRRTDNFIRKGGKNGGPGYSDILVHTREAGWFIWEVKAARSASDIPAQIRRYIEKWDTAKGEIARGWSLDPAVSYVNSSLGPRFVPSYSTGVMTGERLYDVVKPPQPSGNPVSLPDPVVVGQVIGVAAAMAAALFGGLLQGPVTA